MSGEVRALRNTDGSMGVIAFSDALLPLSEVHTRIEQPVACRLQTRETAGGPQNQRRFTPGDFYLHPNGSIIEKSALATVGSMVGPLIVIHAGVQILNAKIHPGVELEQGVVLEAGQKYMMVHTLVIQLRLDKIAASEQSQELAVRVNLPTHN